MTRRQNRFSSILSLFLGLVELGLSFAILLVDYTSKHRMGMQRHVLYLNRKWEEAYPLGLFKVFGLSLIVIFSIFIVYSYIQNKKRRSKIGLMILTMGINGIFIGFTSLSSREINKAYYMVSLLLFLMSLIQNTIYKLNIDRK